MSDLDPELRQLLAPMRESTPTIPRSCAEEARASTEPRSHTEATRAPANDSAFARADGRARAAGGELPAAARERILGNLRQQVRAVPRLRRRARFVRRVRIGALVGAGLLACGAMFWPRLTPGFDALFSGGVASQRTAGVHIAAVGLSPLSWTGAQGVTQELRGELDLPGDGELRVPDRASAQLTTSTGVRIDASERTRVRLRGAAGARDQGLALERGSVRCRVPPLGHGQSFVVSTTTTRVVVHGTDFSVELGTQAEPVAQAETLGAGHAQEAPAPCVRVREGLVEVQHGGAPSAWLGPGSEWGCDEKLASPAAARITSPLPAASNERAGRTRGHHAAHSRALSKAHAADRSLLVEPSREGADTTASAASTLERENQLLADGLRAEQTGDQRAARRLFGALLAEYPHSPLAPEARAGLARTRLATAHHPD